MPYMEQPLRSPGGSSALQPQEHLSLITSRLVRYTPLESRVRMPAKYIYIYFFIFLFNIYFFIFKSFMTSPDEWKLVGRLSI